MAAVVREIEKTTSNRLNWVKDISPKEQIVSLKLRSFSLETQVSEKLQLSLDIMRVHLKRIQKLQSVQVILKRTSHLKMVHS